MNKVIQFELWQDCHFGCKFCSLGRVKTSDQFKLENLHKASTTIMTYEKGQYDIIGFIGESSSMERWMTDCSQNFVS